MRSIWSVSTYRSVWSFAITLGQTWTLLKAYSGHWLITTQNSFTPRTKTLASNCALIHPTKKKKKKKAYGFIKSTETGELGIYHFHCNVCLAKHMIDLSFQQASVSFFKRLHLKEDLHNSKLENVVPVEKNQFKVMPLVHLYVWMST